MSSGLEKPAYWRIVQSRSRYIPSWTPRVKGYVAGFAEPLLEIGRDVDGVVELVDLDSRVGEAALVVGADDRGDEAVFGGLGDVAHGAGG